MTRHLLRTGTLGLLVAGLGAASGVTGATPLHAQLVVGTVTDASASVPAGAGDPRAVEEEWIERTTVTDRFGSFAFCDVTVDRALTLRWRDDRGVERTWSLEWLREGDARWAEITPSGT